jgi:RNA polymerase sigma-70 factor (ECF subfamily)
LQTTTTDLSETELVFLLQQKNKQGYALLYDRYAPTLYGIVLKTTHSDELTQQVIQEVFVQVYKEINTYDSRMQPFFSWLFALTRQTIIAYTNSTHTTNRQATANSD